MTVLNAELRQQIRDGLLQELLEAGAVRPEWLDRRELQRYGWRALIRLAPGQQSVCSLSVFSDGTVRVRVLREGYSPGHWDLELVDPGCIPRVMELIGQALGQHPPDLVPPQQQL